MFSPFLGNIIYQDPFFRMWNTIFGVFAEIALFTKAEIPHDLVIFVQSHFILSSQKSSIRIWPSVRSTIYWKTILSSQAYRKGSYLEFMCLPSLPCWIIQVSIAQLKPTLNTISFPHKWYPISWWLLHALSYGKSERMDNPSVSSKVTHCLCCFSFCLLTH